MKVIFLDFDGVVNTMMYDELEEDMCFSMPLDGKVNNRTAVEYVNQLGEEFGLKVVISSSWREGKNGFRIARECLINGGCRLEIVGATPCEDWYETRHEEIEAYLKEHPEVEDFVVIDDCDDDLWKFHDRFLYVDEWDEGFMGKYYSKAKAICEHSLGWERV